jgi:hypothetical protein
VIQLLNIYLQFEVVDYSTIGEALLKAIVEANRFF